LSCLPTETGASYVLVVDGPGAETGDLFDLLTGLRAWRHAGHKLVCVVRVEAASANAYVFESPECDVRIMLPGSRIGFHHVLITIIEASLAEIKEAVDASEARQRILYTLVAMRMPGGATAESVAALGQRIEESEDGVLYVSAQEAVATGLADRVVDAKP
jgi:ATP-dependent protease ClpP protease subunit